MNALHPAMTAWFLLGVGLAYRSWIWFLRGPKMSGSELRRRYPRLAWMTRGLPVLSVAWALLLAGYVLLNIMWLP